MAFSEQTVIDKIEILEQGQLQIRHANRVLRDGVVIAETYRREVIEPGQDVSGKDPRVQAVADCLWTKDVVAAFAAQKADTK